MSDPETEYMLVTILACIVVYPVLTQYILSYFKLDPGMLAVISILAPLILTLITMKIVKKIFG